jgi:protocatechuate 3,4-dioxygenase beta subunit
MLKRAAMGARRATLPSKERRWRWRRELTGTVAIAILAVVLYALHRLPGLRVPALATARASTSAAKLPASPSAGERRDTLAIDPLREAPRQPALAGRAPAAEDGARAAVCATDTRAECVRVSGSVLDAAGGPIVGARLSAWDPRGALVGEGASDGAGQFRLEVTRGLVRIGAGADGYSEQVRAIEAPLDGLQLLLSAESRIVGRVVMADTRLPVVDALVTASNQDGFPTEPRAARTAADGAFALSGLVVGRYSLAAVAQGGRVEPREIVIGMGESSEPIELRAHAATTLRGVVQVGGAPCARGSVFVQGALILYSALAPDGSVAFDGVPPGHYTVDVRCVGALAWSEHLNVESTPLTRLWDLDRGLELRGVARTADDHPLAGAEIEVVALGEPAARAGTSCVSDERGAFSCWGLVPGEYSCVIGSGLPARSDSVRAAVGPGAAPRVVLRAYATGALRVRLDGSGGFELRTLGVLARSAKQLLVAERRGDEFLFEQLVLGVYEVAIDSAAPGSGRRVELTRAGELLELSLPLPAPQTISGRVVDETGQGVPDAWISVVGGSSFEHLRPATPVLSDAVGEFVVSGLLPAQYELSASGGRRTAQLELPSGSQGVLVTLREAEAAPGAETVGFTPARPARRQ